MLEYLAGEQGPRRQGCRGPYRRQEGEDVVALSSIEKAGQHLLPAVLQLSQSMLAKATLFVAVLAFSVWMGMSFHWDYPFPLHVDEYLAIGHAQAVLHAGRLSYPSPFDLNDIRYYPEFGFHLVIGYLHTLTGLGWVELFRIAPGVAMMALSLGAYAFGSRAGFGWAAALFMPFIPSSIRTLGPTFVVPVTVGLILLPLILLALRGLEGRHWPRWLALLAVLIGGLQFIHPPTTSLVLLLTGIFALAVVVQMVAQGRRGPALALVLAYVGGALLVSTVVWTVAPSLARQTLEAALPSQPGTTIDVLGRQLGFLQAFGTVVTTLAVAGVFLFVLRREYGLLSMVVPVFTLFLVGFLTILFPKLHLGPDILFERIWNYLALMLALFAGYAVVAYFHAIPQVVSLLTARVPALVPGYALAVLIVVGVVVLGWVVWRDRLQNEDFRARYGRFYHMVNMQHQADFLWLAQHTVPGEPVALGESSLAWAYAPLGGPQVRAYESIAAPWSSGIGEALRRMVRTGEADLHILHEFGIRLVYTCYPASTECPDISGEGVYKVGHGMFVVSSVPPAS